ncbi:PIN domain-containing protein [Aeromonas media]|uniref:PIN domain-containing protein n=1 Tax=Aeromonas media TaxID=651 RepID=UPI00143D9285|nr:PIN domain-containing protein [Aeromonas media]MBS4699368.1 DUF4935 domain-containing protein [Aeromonas media]QIY85861.1 DUF4935 domain-containing protein [Aeromonas hydrophila]
MDIFLDSNIIFNNWHFKNANLQYLLHFIKNEGHTLIISDVVIKEINNKHKQELDKAKGKLIDAVGDLFKLTQINEVMDVEKFNTKYSLVDTLKQLNVDYNILNCDAIPQELIIDRAIAGVRPFQDSEKGYRDTVIWMEFLNHARSNTSDDEIIFICENKNDFYDTANRTNTIVFHPDLERDLLAIKPGKKIIPFLGVPSFIESRIDRDEHCIDRTEFEGMISEAICDESEKYILNLSPDYFAGLLSEVTPNINNIHMSISSVDIVEDIEDPEIISSEALDDNKVYVSYRYNLRIVFVTVRISYGDYISNKHVIHNETINVEIKDEDISFDLYIRPYFDVSFVYNRDSEELDGFTVDNFYFLR